MKTSNILLVVMIFSIISACSVTKKSSTSASASPAPSTTATPPVTDNYLFTSPARGLQAPGDEELTVMQMKFKEVTLDHLKEGYVIYTQTACVSCHSAQNIYQKTEEQWKPIIDDMSFRANLSDQQKDAVYKYVLAIKGTQPK
jgi:cytochrome c551/c552